MRYWAARLFRKKGSPATTALFGFKDDVVVRVRPDGNSSRIDVRSLSRVGGGDIGTNAKRVRAFLQRLAETHAG